MSNGRGTRAGVERAREFAEMALAGFVPDVRADLGQRIRFRPTLDLTGDQRASLRLVKAALRHAPLMAQEQAWSAIEGMLDTAHEAGRRASAQATSALPNAGRTS